MWRPWRTDYGIMAKVTQLTLDGNWLDADDKDLSAFRNAAVYTLSENLTLAEEPYDADVAGTTIELDGLYDGLKSGRWVIVSGERTDIPATGGVKVSELAMIQSVEQRVSQVPNQNDPTKMDDLPGDKLHSFLVLSTSLAYSYKRTSVTLYGNVVKATHGETRTEVLGNGSGAASMQRFVLKQSPLTYVSAPNQRGVDSTLEVRVNDLLWTEVDSLSGLSPTSRSYVVQTGDDDRTAVIFGNGEQGRGCRPVRRT